MSKSDEQIRREERERRAIAQAKQQRRSHSYVDDDGCEVTVTPSGHALYNASEWW